MNNAEYDAVVVGGGPAGLSGALYLGRARRRTLVVDAGKPRNARARAAHGVFTRDGMPPRELLAEARRQLENYPGVEVLDTEAMGALTALGGFEVRLKNGDSVRARRLLLACGVRDELPAIEGLSEHWGTRVHGCTYCDGYEGADRPLAAFARGETAVKLAASLLQLSDDIVICSDGPVNLSTEDRWRIYCRGVRVYEAKILKVSAVPDGIAIHLGDGSVIVRSAIFLKTTTHIASGIPMQLGCALKGASLVVDKSWQTTVPGVYAAGDVAGSSKFVAGAAANGAEAATWLDGSLTEEDFARV